MFHFYVLRTLEQDIFCAFQPHSTEAHFLSHYWTAPFPKHSEDRSVHMTQVSAGARWHLEAGNRIIFLTEDRSRIIHKRRRFIHGFKCNHMTILGPSWGIWFCSLVLLFLQIDSTGSQGIRKSFRTVIVRVLPVLVPYKSSSGENVLKPSGLWGGILLHQSVLM